MNFNTHLTSESTIIGHKPSHTIIKCGALAATDFSSGTNTTEPKSTTDKSISSGLASNAPVSSLIVPEAAQTMDIQEMLSNYSNADCLSILAKANKALNESKPFGVHAWDFLTSALPLFGFKIPGWLIALIAAIAAKYFAWSIALCCMLFVMVQCLISVQQTNANTMSIGPLKLNELYMNRRIGSIDIPGWLIAGLSAYIVLCFSGTIVNGILAGLLCWTIWSVIQTKNMGAIIDDCKTSVGANDDTVANIVQKIVDMCDQKQIDIVEMFNNIPSLSRSTDETSEESRTTEEYIPVNTEESINNLF